MTAIVRDFWIDFKVYVGRVSQFNSTDWLVYILWNGMMVGLLAAVSGFLYWGSSHGVEYPVWVWNIPVGIACFVVAIAIDTIGHRTVYKEALAEGEALIHHITIISGISSVILLCLGYEHPEQVRIPAMVLIFLSVVYSFFDEALHWHRYLTKKSDRIEMWSHYFILVGHLIMIIGWWKWFDEGYPGVKETLLWLPK
jgi:hypothetical protein